MPDQVKGKTLFYFFAQCCYGEVWLDEEANVVSYIHENDGHWRAEYYRFIPEFFGGNIVSIDVSKLDNKALDNDVMYDDFEEFVEEHREALLKIIKKWKKKNEAVVETKP